MHSVLPVSTWKDTQQALANRESQSQWNTTSNPQGWLLSKRQIIISKRKNTEKLEPLHTAGRKVKGTSTVENSLVVPEEVDIELSYDSEIPPLNYT